MSLMTEAAVVAAALLGAGKQAMLFARFMQTQFLYFV